ncbi:hypothetical protein RUND412_010744 [Rhizina undulata]
MMETEAARPAPSRYRTIRRKIQGGNSEPKSSHSELAPQQEPVVKQSRFRHLLRLNTSTKEPSPPPVQTGGTGFRKSSKTNSPKKSKEAGHEDFIPRGLVAELVQGGANGAKVSAERTKSHDGAGREPNFDFKVPVQLDKGSHGHVKMGVLDTTECTSFLEQANPGKERVLLECWPSLGLHRQVRRFELIRDVTNTWDSDTDCYLRVRKELWGQTSRSLEDFPKEHPAPQEAHFYYYSKAEKKFQRRTVKLGNGLLRISKKDKPSEKDFLQTINLEYFDVYTFFDTFAPNPKLKCPTKFCFVLKSQHKQSIFGKDSVYCHYFATDSEAHFKTWFEYVRDWKSRLIAEKMSIAPWTAEPETETKSNGSKVSSPIDTPARGRKPQPLISPEELAQLPVSVDMPRSKSLHRAKSTKRSAKDSRPKTGVVSDDEAVFSTGGLLGADYEERRRLAQIQYKEERAHDFKPFPTPPSTSLFRSHTLRDGRQPLIQMDQVPKESSPSLHSKSSFDTKPLQRRETIGSRPTTAHKQGTLLSFDATEPVPALPHRRGKGHAVSEKEAKDKGGLISFATSPIDPPAVPALPVMASLAHRRTVKGRTHRGESGDEDNGPFTGIGLLAHSYQSSGAGAIGHGVANSRDAMGKNGEIRPLLGNMQQSVFAPGSLLEKREREMGVQGPIIDRDPHSSDED